MHRTGPPPPSHALPAFFGQNAMIRRERYPFHSKEDAHVALWFTPPALIHRRVPSRDLRRSGPPQKSGSHPPHPTTRRLANHRGLAARSRLRYGTTTGRRDARVPFNYFNGLAGGNLNYFKPLAGTVPDALGLPQPETPFENLAYQANSGLTSMLATYGLGSLIGFGPTVAAAPTATQVIGKALTANPGAQAASATASGVALGLAQNAGTGPGGNLPRPRLPAWPHRAAGRRGPGLPERESCPPLKTTAHETGVSGLPAAQWKLMQTQDWLDAKGGDLVAAQRMVDHVWTPARTEQLRAKLTPGRETVFISVPSTSGTNRIPDALGLRLEGFGPREYSLLSSLHIEELEKRLDNNDLDGDELNTSIMEEGRLVYRCEKCLRLFVYEPLKGKESCRPMNRPSCSKPVTTTPSRRFCKKCSKTEAFTLPAYVRPCRAPSP